MKKFLICCLLGNTTDSLAKKIQLLVKRKGRPLIVNTAGLENFASVASAFDGFLITPHIQYKTAEIRGVVGNACSIIITENLSCASLDAEKVFAFVMAQVPELAI